jgi:hypothetical protein
VVAWAGAAGGHQRMHGLAVADVELDAEHDRPCTVRR